MCTSGCNAQYANNLFFMDYNVKKLYTFTPVTIYDSQCVKFCLKNTLVF